MKSKIIHNGFINYKPCLIILITLMISLFIATQECPGAGAQGSGDDALTQFNSILVKFKEFNSPPPEIVNIAQAFGKLKKEFDEKKNITPSDSAENIQNILDLFEKIKNPKREVATQIEDIKEALVKLKNTLDNKATTPSDSATDKNPEIEKQKELISTLTQKDKDNSEKIKDLEKKCSVLDNDLNVEKSSVTKYKQANQSLQENLKQANNALQEKTSPLQSEIDRQKREIEKLKEQSPPIPTRPGGIETFLPSILLASAIIILALFFALYIYDRKTSGSTEDKIDSPIEKSSDKSSAVGDKKITEKLSQVENQLVVISHQLSSNTLKTDVSTVKALCNQILTSYSNIVTKLAPLDSFDRKTKDLNDKTIYIQGEITSLKTCIKTSITEYLDSYYKPEKIDELLKHIGDRNLASYLQKLQEELNDNISQKTKIAEYENKYKSLTDFIEGSNNKLKEIKREIDEFKTTNRGLLSDIEKKDKAIGILTGEKTTVVSRLDELEKTIVTNKKEITEIKSRLVRKETEFDNLKNELKIILPNYESDLAFFGEIFGDDWKQEVLLSFLLLQSEANNKSEGIRATFSRLDDAIYDTYSDNPARLKSVRNMIQAKVNGEILAGKYQIQWPLPGDELNERIHSAETSSGNRIKIARTAIVKDANGVLITKSKVRTEV